MTSKELLRQIKELKPSSKFGESVQLYALEIVERAFRSWENVCINHLEEYMLCGASNWQQYSSGGCSLISDEDIISRCYDEDVALSEIREKDGVIVNSRGKTMIQVQGQRLGQAYRIVESLICINDI